MLMSVWIAAVADSGAARLSSPPEVDSEFSEPFRKLLGELHSRGLMPTEEGAVRRLVVEALLQGVGVGGRIVDSSGKEDADQEPLVEGIRSLNGHFGYWRVLSVGDGFAKAAEEAFGTWSADREGGLVVDLRGVSGNGLEEAEPVAVAAADRALPMVVLIDERTQAGGEVLAAQLRDRCGGVLMGRATRGLPYPLRPVTLTPDLRVLLPDVPAGKGRKPLLPDVALAADGGTTSASGAADSRPAADPSRDDCIRRAVDLLTAISTFRQKHF